MKGCHTSHSEDTETKKHMEYKNIVLEAMGGSTSEDDNKKREKIIRNIAKEVTIDKIKQVFNNFFSLGSISQKRKYSKILYPT